MFRLLIAVFSLLGMAGVGLADDEKKPEGNPGLGTWRQVAVVVDGQDVPVGRATLMTVTPEGWSITVNDAPYLKGTTKVVGRDDHVQADVSITEGTLAGVILKQISQIDGDVMYACQAPQERDRPTAFTSKPGSGHTLSIWLRVR